MAWRAMARHDTNGHPNQLSVAVLIPTLNAATPNNPVVLPAVGAFKATGAAMTIGSLGAAVGLGPSIEAAACVAATALYWKIGYDDMKNTHHAIRR